MVQQQQGARPPRPKPVPVPDTDTEPYWQAAKQHQIKLPRCKQCGHFSFPPRPDRCPRCLSTTVEWSQLSGRGTVYSFTVMHDSLVRGFPPPYVVAQVDLEEQRGLRLTCNILDCNIQDVRIGMPVEVVFEDRTEEVSLPQFRPRK